MKKNERRKKAFALPIVMTAMLLSTLTMTAQVTVDENASYDLNNQRFGAEVSGGYDLNNQTFGQDEFEGFAPLGSGLFLMAAAGAAYALKKRKTNK